MSSDISGTYDIEAQTPIGCVRGTAVLSQSGARVSGRIDMGSLGHDDMSGTCDEHGAFRASGERRQFPFGKVAYEVTGTVDEAGRLHAKLVSRVADIEISGLRR